MPLTELVIATRKVPYNTQVIEVRGLCLDDVTALMADHFEKLNQFVEFIKETIPKKREQNLKDIASKLIRESPKLVYAALALAADSPGLENKIARLPLTVQLELVVVVGELTFVDEEGAADFLGNALRLFEAGKKNLLTRTATPESGTST